MRYIFICMACVLALAGCGGGGGSADNSIKLKGTVEGYGIITAINVYPQGHLGETSHLISSVPGPKKFVIGIPEPGVYDLQILFDYTSGMDGPMLHGEKVITNVQVDAPETDLGTISMDLPAPT